MMPVNWVKVTAGFMFLMVILGCGFPFINDNRQEARRSVVITIDLNQRQEFFDQLNEFAKINSFSILIDTLSSSDEKFQIYMSREDVIISGASPFEPNEYHIAFFDVTTRPPATDSVFDDLISELEQYVSKVPGATFRIRE